ncbi:hypothetical protein ABT095_22290 [Kitasatospora sp. NPDC002227]|uniref:WXG100 family type VII secretion target n=1 Tax=Kitasatospora sp. NPDC002227 TaxID=3154773 RepID=UPI003331E82D
MSDQHSEEIPAQETPRLREGFLLPREEAPTEAVSFERVAERAEPVRMRLRETESVPAEMPLQAETPLQAVERERAPLQPLEQDRIPLRPTEQERVAPQPFEQDRMPLQPVERAEPVQARLREAESVPAEATLQPLEQERAPLQPTERGRPVSDQDESPRLMPEERAAPTRLTPRMGTTMAGQRAGAANAQGGGGGAGQGFQVDVDQYRAAVSPVLEAADQITQLATRLSSYLTGAEGSSPWGDDESGKQFAEGEKGYLKYSKETQSGLKSLGSGLKQVSDGLKSMADGYQNSEQSLTGEFNGQDGGGQVGATPPPAYTAQLPTMPYNLRPTTGKH